jgi:hypothetical protein
MTADGDVLRALASSVKGFEGVSVEAMGLLGLPAPVTAGA